MSIIRPIDRRSFIAGGVLVTGSAASSFALAQSISSDVTIVSSIPPLPNDLFDKAELPPAAYVESDVVGTAPPSPVEIDQAYELLFNSPIGVAPIDVAHYFLAAGAGAYGSEYRKFAREWPVRANPAIYHFFSATQTKPEGDSTAWCAAFVNWCILRAHASAADEIGLAPGSYSKNGKPFDPKNTSQYSTNHASSGSFRCWETVAQPKRGDIAVFRNAGTEELSTGCRGTGHVAFYVRMQSPNIVQLLGGNQSQPGSNGAITIANMPTQPGSRFMKYVSLKAR